MELMGNVDIITHYFLDNSVTVDSTLFPPCENTDKMT